MIDKTAAIKTGFIKRAAHYGVCQKRAELLFEKQAEYNTPGFISTLSDAAKDKFKSFSALGGITGGLGGGLGAAAGGLAGAGLGYLGGGLMGGTPEEKSRRRLQGALLGGGLGGVGGATIGGGLGGAAGGGAGFLGGYEEASGRFNDVSPGAQKLSDSVRNLFQR